ncbi:MAG: endolytic transglycosylase MltG, partial [Myxococcota bacterium]|nr:endolytic transglycosylase MltG [Myxococcota bacterium]
TVPLTVPEGFEAREIAARVAEVAEVAVDSVRALVADTALADRLGVPGPTLEGYLFPETYHFARGLAPRALAEAMVEEFLRAWEPLAPKARARGLSMREVVTLASIVEKETAVPEERPLVSAVFHNRLARGMRLETDPTVIYGIPDFDGNLRRVHLEDETNPYNTYRIPGLPPGPIANPGAEALRATVEPADVDYLFFVSRNDGSHVFSETWRAHANAVNRYQRGGRER